MSDGRSDGLSEAPPAGAISFNRFRELIGL